MFPNDVDKEIKGRKVILMFSLRQFKFTPLQLERLKIVMGTRWKEGKDKQKLVIERFQTF
jgi:hypothetical protein